MQQPMARVTLAYCGGLLLAECLQPPLGFLFALCLAVVAGAFLKAAWRPWLLWVFLGLVGWTNLVSRTAILSPHDLRASQGDTAAIVTVRGTLAETPTQRVFVQDQQESWHSLAQVRVSQLLRHNQAWAPAFGTVLTYTPGLMPKNYFAGQAVEITGVLAPPPGARAEGLFDYRAYLRRQGVYYQLKTESTNDWRLLSPQTSPPLSDRFLAWAQQMLRRGLPAEDESLRLLWAMTLGWKTALTNEVYEPFMKSGTMHIFAISGLHIALIAALLVSLLRVARFSRRWCALIVIPLIWFYTGATGWQPSAIRSTIMMSIIIGGWILHRPTDLLNSLAAAAFIILLWDPQQLFGASFQLSFFVVLSIALLLPRLEELRDRLLQTDPLLPAELVPRWRRWLDPPLRWLTTSLAISLASWLGSLPLTAYYFHLLSPVTLLANLAIVPMSSAALASNLGSLLCGPWCPWLSELFNHSAWAWMEGMVRFSQWTTTLPAACFNVRGPSLPGMGAYYAVLIAAFSGWLFRPAGRLWKAAALGLLFLLWAGHAWREASVTRLTILPANGSLAVYADAAQRKDTLLLDPGVTNTVQFLLKPFLRAQGLNRLPGLVLTHGDSRHIGGADLAADLFSARQVFASPLRFRSPAYRRLLSHFAQRPGWLGQLKANDSLGHWTILYPPADQRVSRADDGALVLRGQFGSTRILLLSDLGRLGQDALRQTTPDLRAEIVVAGLPANGQPLNDALLDAIAPRLIIVADSEFPPAERASPALRQRLRQRQVPLIYTRSAGATTLELSRGTWEVRTMSGLRIRAADSPPEPPAQRQTRMTRIGTD